MCIPLNWVANIPPQTYTVADLYSRATTTFTPTPLRINNNHINENNAFPIPIWSSRNPRRQRPDHLYSCTSSLLEFDGYNADNTGGCHSVSYVSYLCHHYLPTADRSQLTSQNPLSSRSPVVNLHTLCESCPSCQLHPPHRSRCTAIQPCSTSSPVQPGLDFVGMLGT